MKNVTVALDEEVACWARVRAAELDITVLRLLGDLLQEQMRREVTYQTEMRQYLLRKRRPINADGSAYSSRDELHDRINLR